MAARLLFLPLPLRDLLHRAADFRQVAPILLDSGDSLEEGGSRCQLGQFLSAAAAAAAKRTHSGDLEFMATTFLRHSV